MRRDEKVIEKMCSFSEKIVHEKIIEINEDLKVEVEWLTSLIENTDDIDKKLPHKRQCKISIDYQ